MRCNACWLESEGQAIATTCGHLFYVLVLYVFHIDMDLFYVVQPPTGWVSVEELERQSWELRVRIQHRRDQVNSSHLPNFWWTGLSDTYPGGR